MTRRGWIVAVGSVTAGLAVIAACTGDDPPQFQTPEADASSGGTTSSSSSGSSGSSGTSGTPTDSGTDAHVPTLCELPATGTFANFLYNRGVGATHRAAAGTSDGWVVAGDIQTPTGGGPLSYTDAGLLLDASDHTQFADVVRYDRSGKVLWQKAFGGSSTEGISSVTVDDSDNVYIAGYSDSPTIKFGTTTLSAASGTIGFVAKLAAATGEPIWARSYLAGQYGYGQGCAAIDYDNGNLVVGCSMGKTQSYDDATGPKTLSAGELSASALHSLDPATGLTKWATAVSSGVDGNQTSIESVDVKGGFISLAGVYDGTQLAARGDVGIPRVGTETNGFVIEYTVEGDRIFAKGFGASADAGAVQNVFAVGTSATGGVQVNASFNGKTSLGGSFDLSSKGGTDVFVANFDNKAGAPGWVKVIGGEKNEEARGMAQDPCGAPTALMTIASVLDKMDGVPLPAPQNSYANSVLKFDPTGTLRWAHGVGRGSDADNVVVFWGVASNPRTGETRAVGGFRGNLDFGDGKIKMSTGFNPFSLDFSR